ncbi:MAG: ribonuclease HI family protein [Candidatus Humimicrobiaceae bacterium]
MKNSAYNMVEIYTDGGSRGNPGQAAIGFLIYGPGKVILEQYSECIGIKTNNYAEYYAIIKALAAARKYNPEEVVIYTDSSLAYNQINGFWKIKDEEIKKMVFRVNKEIVNFKIFKIFYIPREKNKEADKLVNIALNLNAAN